jgi:hypothetical protein
MITSAATPPTTPPAIAPAGGPGEGSGVAVEVDALLVVEAVVVTLDLFPAVFEVMKGREIELRALVVFVGRMAAAWTYQRLQVKQLQSRKITYMCQMQE